MVHMGVGYEDCVYSCELMDPGEIREAIGCRGPDAYPAIEK
jgi:hypothetical protein